MTTFTKRKTILEMTREFRPFWESYLTSKGIDNFTAKLCYLSSDFSEAKVPALRFYPSELSKAEDIYVELFDWNDEPYTPGYRVLYKLEGDSNWKDSGKFVEITKKANGDPLPNPTYAIELKDLKKVLQSPVVNRIYQEEEFLEEEKTESVTFEAEQLDAHYAHLTIRDIYAIVHNKAVSNKKWLNELIKKEK